MLSLSRAAPCAGPSACSDDGLLVAATETKQRCVVRSAADLQVVARKSLPGTVATVTFAADNDLVCCAIPELATAVLFSCRRAPRWQCRIDEGCAGLAWARFCPSARHVLTMSDHRLHLSVWSLATAEAAAVVAHPKPSPGCVAFSRNEQFAAVATRAGCKDSVSVYRCDTWAVETAWPVETVDVQGLEWAPDGGALVAMDTSLSYALLVYTPLGELLARHEPYRGALGLKTMAWAPAAGGPLAAGSFDEKLRLYSPLTHRCTAEYAHASFAQAPKAGRVWLFAGRGQAVVAPPAATAAAAAGERSGAPAAAPAVDKENPAAAARAAGKKAAAGGLTARAAPTGPLAAAAAAAATASATASDETFPPPAPTQAEADTADAAASAADADAAVRDALCGFEPLAARRREAVAKLPVGVTSVRPDTTKPNPRLGVGLAAWSADGRFLATRNDNMPTTLWVWDTDGRGLVALFTHPEGEHVRAVKWNPSRCELAYSTGGDAVHVWSPVQDAARQTSFALPADFGLRSARWLGDRGLCLVGREEVRLARLAEEA